MKLAQNKNIKLFAVSLLAAIAVLGGSSFSSVQAGNPELPNPTLAICYNEIAKTFTELDLRSETATKQCQDVPGQRIIKGGEALPVPVCVNSTDNVKANFNIILAESNRAGCTNFGGYIIEAGGTLPKFNASGQTSGSTRPKTCVEDNYESSGCRITAEDCAGGNLTEQNCGITRLITVLVNVLSGLVGISVVIVFILGGIQYSSSAGDPQAAAAAKKKISNAILALVLFGIMYGFLQWIVPGGLF